MELNLFDLTFRVDRERITPYTDLLPPIQSFSTTKGLAKVLTGTFGNKLNDYYQFLTFPLKVVKVVTTPAKGFRFLSNPIGTTKRLLSEFRLNGSNHGPYVFYKASVYAKPQTFSKGFLPLRWLGSKTPRPLNWMFRLLPTPSERPGTTKVGLVWALDNRTGQKATVGFSLDPCWNLSEEIGPLKLQNRNNEFVVVPRGGTSLYAETEFRNQTLLNALPFSAKGPLVNMEEHIEEDMEESMDLPGMDLPFSLEELEEYGNSKKIGIIPMLFTQLFALRMDSLVRHRWLGGRVNKINKAIKG